MPAAAPQIPLNAVRRTLSDIADARQRDIAAVAVRELDGCGIPEAEARVAAAWLAGEGDLVRILAGALDAERRRRPQPRLSSRVVITRAPKGVRVDVEDVPTASEQDY